MGEWRLPMKTALGTCAWREKEKSGGCWEWECAWGAGVRTGRNSAPL